MKDLDFDEIDRAVNSLKASTPTDNDDSNNSLQPVDNQLPVPAELPASLTKKRSSGQFMDVVHPSSDMRKSSHKNHKKKPFKNTISNDEPTIEPVADVITTDSTPPETHSNDNDWPDPIDSHPDDNDAHNNDEKPAQDLIDDSDIDKISDDITNELSQKTEELSDSPFISGAKVEKRPLGAFSNDPTTQTTKQADKQDITDQVETIDDVIDKAEPVLEPSVITDSTLPEELQDDLLLIESGDSSTDPKSLPIKPKIVATPVPMVANTPAPVAVAPVVAVKTPTVAVDDAPATKSQPIGPTSITQQYKEQPSTGDQTSGAIYNTDSYHKALLPPIKKKTGWLWVVWVIILIIVGVGAGVAVYTFLMPLL